MTMPSSTMAPADAGALYLHVRVLPGMIVGCRGSLASTSGSEHTRAKCFSRRPQAASEARASRACDVRTKVRSGCANGVQVTRGGRDTRPTDASDVRIESPSISAPRAKSGA